jgi:hypothetical protein
MVVPSIRTGRSASLSRALSRSEVRSHRLKRFLLSRTDHYPAHKTAEPEVCAIRYLSDPPSLFGMNKPHSLFESLIV